MTNFARIEQIFTEAVSKPDAAAREVYLHQVCEGDTQLRLRVEELLAADAEPGSFLPLPDEGSTVNFTPVSERPGTTVGRYKLLEQIGEGGFGVVFMAEQEQPVRRRVALKVIKAGMDTRQVVARFEAERQALAMMDHPNIAKVFDAGATETGRPYFVMELVRGLPITEYSDEARLSTDERLGLFQSVCSAIQHAHQKGIIHRDLKPSNVLVTMHDDKAVPKVIDFGVAKATQGRLTEQTLFTEFRAMIGTPNYMSPEQAHMSGLDVDTRSDIYSLGVLLYELLTGTTPIDTKQVAQATYDDLRRIICEEEPPRPSARLSTLTEEQLTTLARQRHCEPTQLAVSLRSDLDWIVMKCLEKDRTRRYQSANSLAADVERYLKFEPVEACPPSAAYRLRKFVRRNKVAVVTAAAILISLTSAAGLSTWLYLREREARRQAEIGSAIFDVANPFRNNSQEEAEQSLASLKPHSLQMDARNRAKFYYRLGDLRARQGLWKESAEYYAKGLEQQPDPLFFEPWHYYLPALVQSGNVEAYHVARQVVVQRFAETTDPRIAECTLKDCLLTPWPDADFDQLQQLARTMLQAEDHWAWNYFQFAAGLFEYRRGNYEAALRHTRRVVADSNEYYLNIPNQMIMAMALQLLGETAEASQVLYSGLELAQTSLRREALLTPDRLWSDWVIAHALVDEAAALIDPQIDVELSNLQAFRRHPAFVIDNLFFLVLEKLRSEDEVGYRQACDALAQVPANSGNTTSEFRRIWAWSLGPHRPSDLQGPLEAAKKMAKENKLGANYAERLLLGTMFYRVGEYESAEEHLKASIATYPKHPPFGFRTVIYPQLMLSMVYSRLGRHDEAGRLLEETEPPIHAARSDPSTSWEYRETIKLLLREAEALIGRDQPDASADQDHSPPVAAPVPEP